MRADMVLVSCCVHADGWIDSGRLRAGARFRDVFAILALKPYNMLTRPRPRIKSPIPGFVKPNCRHAGRAAGLKIIILYKT
jgi:hypothetical protein